MKKINVAHDTVIYYLDRLGCRREKVVEVEEELLEPESFEECRELIRLRDECRIFLEPLKDLQRLIMKLDENVDVFNKMQVIFVTYEYHLRYLQAMPWFKLFMRPCPTRRALEEYMISKTSLVDLIKRVEEMIVLLEDDLIFPMVALDYAMITNFNDFIEYVLKTFQEVEREIFISKDVKRSQLLNVPSIKSSI